MSATCEKHKLDYYDSCVECENKEPRDKYEDLIYQVATKFPNETRHETARRYITERENRPPASGAVAEKESK